MKLNYDCVRDVLLKLEEILTCEYSDGTISIESINIDNLYQALSDDYSVEDIFYSAYNLEQAGFLDANFLFGDGRIVDGVIFNITYSGHQFLQQIRPKTVWDKSKSVFKNIGTISVDIIKSVTSTILTDTINHYIHLPDSSNSTWFCNRQREAFKFRIAYFFLCKISDVKILTISFLHFCISMLSNCILCFSM